MRVFWLNIQIIILYRTRSSWLNCALRDDEAVYWISIGHYEAVAVGNWWYWVSRGHLCLYILHKVEIWSGVTDALLTDWQSLKEWSPRNAISISILEWYLKILWELCSAGITRVHGDEVADCGIHRNVLVHELKPWLLLADGVLNALHLRQYHKFSKGLEC